MIQILFLLGLSGLYANILLKKVYLETGDSIYPVNILVAATIVGTVSRIWISIMGFTCILDDLFIALLSYYLMGLILSLINCYYLSTNMKHDVEEKCEELNYDEHRK